MLEAELYIEWVLRPRQDAAQSVRARMRREALRESAASREVRQRSERATGAARTARARWPIGRTFPD
ncbi:MAG: hypothetical protein HY874_02495 [Chloroflexi bacterium]|nr:hypothetical protein [Chloroflexota bacterium]